MNEEEKVFSCNAKEERCEKLVSDLTESLKNFNSLTAEGKEKELSRISEILLNKEYEQEDFHTSIWVVSHHHLLDCLAHGTPTLRRFAGTILGDMCKKLKSQVYVDCKDFILNEIEVLLKLAEKQFREPVEKINSSTNQDVNVSEVASTNTSFQCLPTSPAVQHGLTSEEILKNTLTWKHLDSWICCLEKITSSCGDEFCEHADARLLNCVSLCLNCSDRYLEQDCMKFVCTLVQHCKIYSFLTKNNNEQLKDLLTSLVLKGLSNPWSDVKYQSLMAVKSLFLSFMSEDGAIESLPSDMLVQFLPPLCFNRYSSEIGLQSFCQNTWMELTQGRGKVLMERYMDPAFEYYIQMLSDGKSLETFVTACHCLSEVIRKLERNIVGPKIHELYEKLKSAAFESTSSLSHSSKESACLLCADVVENYPQEMLLHVQELTQIMNGLLEHRDSRTRDASAIVLAVMVKVYKPESLTDMMSNIKTAFKELRSKYEEEKKETAMLSSATGICNKIASAAINSPDIISSQQPHSIAIATIRTVSDGLDYTATNDGSMKPKVVVTLLDRSSSLNTQSEVWASAHGHFCLLFHLASAIPQNSLSEISSLLPDLANTISVGNQEQRYRFAHLVFDRLPQLFSLLGKQQLRRYLEFFLATLVEVAQQSDDREAQNASVLCLEKLGQLLGMNILKERVKSIDRLFAEKFFRE